MDEPKPATTTAEVKEDKKSKSREPNEMKDNAQGVPVMHIKVYAPFKVYYDQDAESISAENDTGVFDVLPHHKSFMTLLSPCDIVIRNHGAEDFKVKITRAIMHIKADEIRVFLDV